MLRQVAGSLCLVGLLAVPGCKPELTPPEAAQIVCHEQGDCPTDWVCDTRANRCRPATAPPPRCGDGVLDPDEECDCGEKADALPATCRGPNDDAQPDRCRTDCRLPRCGDRALDGQEECDDGNDTNGDGCSAACLRERCGNTRIDPGEVCDDGNVLAADGCSADCKSKETCGNGIVDFAKGEGCDCGDGTLPLPPGCEAANGAETSHCSGKCVTVFCGNGVENEGEDCDDGNAERGDGCGPSCRFETCGNGVLDPGEGCDDGGLVAGDQCGPTCQIEACGNGLPDPGEVCDEGDTQGGDGCSADCRSDETCGNGVVDVQAAPVGEQCDCGADEGSLSPGCTAPNGGKECRADCTIRRCGDGIPDPLEGCDEGAANSDEPDAACRTTCQPRRCGDLIKDVASGEVCDDGNTAAGDGCSPDCRSDETCGNGIVDVEARPTGEQCDCGADEALRPARCAKPNSTAPDATCRPGCLLQRCGDGIVDSARGEACDTTVPAGRDCTSFGFYDAPGLACGPTCALDTSGCTGSCGDHALQAREACEGRAPAGESCPGYGFDGGRLGCSPGCGPDFSDCWRATFAFEAKLPFIARALWGSGPENVFAVGDSGMIQRFDGTAWKAMTSGTTQGLKAVWGSGAKDVYAVGAGGAFLHFDGLAWKAGALATTSDLETVWGSSASDVYVAGGTSAWHFDGKAWSEVAAGTLGMVVDFWGSGPSDVYAAEAGNRVMHWDGITWSVGPSFSGVDTCAAVWGSGPSDVWVAGEAGTLLHWDGAAWGETRISSRALNAVWGTGPQDVYTTDGATLYHFDGTLWSPVAQDSPGSTAALWGSAAGDVFAVGAGEQPGQGIVQHLRRTGWTRLEPPQVAATVSFNGVWASGPNDVFIVGSGGTILHFDGKAFSVMSSKTVLDLSDVWGAGPGDVYAVGAQGTILHFDGTAWSPMVSGTETGLAGIQGTSATNIWACGGTGVVLAYNGVSWRTPAKNSLPIPNLLADCLPNTVVGWGGKGLGYMAETYVDVSGATLWRRVVLPSGTPTLTGLWRDPNGVTWLVGEGGTILRYAKQQFVAMDSGTTQDLTDVWGRGPEDIYAVGKTGTLLHFDGLGWSPLRTLTLAALQAVGGSSSQVVAVGQIGTVLRHSRRCAPVERACLDGRDDDCDGLHDCADPDCGKDPACAAGGLCQGAAPISCGVAVSGALVSGPGRLQRYYCDPWLESGREAIYRIDPDADASITVTLSGMTTDLDLVVLEGNAGGGCEPGFSGCRAAASTVGDPEQVTFDAFAGRSYFLVVEGYTQSSGTFSLEVACQ